MTTVYMQPQVVQTNSYTCIDKTYSSHSLGSKTNSRRMKQENSEAEYTLLSSPTLGSIYGLSKDFQEQFTVKGDEAVTTNFCTLRHGCPSMLPIWFSSSKATTLLSSQKQMFPQLHSPRRQKEDEDIICRCITYSADLSCPLPGMKKLCWWGQRDLALIPLPCIQNKFPSDVLNNRRTKDEVFFLLSFSLISYGICKWLTSGSGAEESFIKGELGSKQGYSDRNVQLYLK